MIRQNHRNRKYNINTTINHKLQVNFGLKWSVLKSLHIWLFKVIHSKMVRWAEIDRQGLAAAAAAECIYRYYHPVCNAGDLCWRHAIRLQRRMTSHQNEKDRWSRHYSCSQNFPPIALFGKKTLSLQVWCQIFFENWIWETVMSSLLETQQTSSLSVTYRGFIFFDKLIIECTNLLFSPSLSQVAYTMNSDGEGTGRSRAVSVITGKATFSWLQSIWSCKRKNKCTDAEPWPDVQHGCKFLLRTQLIENTTGLAQIRCRIIAIPNIETNLKRITSSKAVVMEQLGTMVSWENRYSCNITTSVTTLFPQTKMRQWKHNFYFSQMYVTYVKYFSLKYILNAELSASGHACRFAHHRGGPCALRVPLNTLLTSLFTPVTVHSKTCC